MHGRLGCTQHTLECAQGLGCAAVRAKRWVLMGRLTFFSTADRKRVNTRSRVTARERAHCNRAVLHVEMAPKVVT